jgi:hypothetical protein
VTDIVNHLLSFEASLRIPKGLDPDTALFVSKRGRSKGTSTNLDGQRAKPKCFGCGKRGHIMAECWNKDQWTSFTEEKSKSETKFTSVWKVDYRSFLFQIIKAMGEWRKSDLNNYGFEFKIGLE